MPPWFALGGIVAVAVLCIWLLFSGLSNSSGQQEVVTTAGPDAPAVSVDLQTSTLAGPAEADEPTKPAPAPTQQPQPSPDSLQADSDLPVVTVAPDGRRLISRDTSVLSTPLTDDGNTVEVTSYEGLSLIPRNLLATATAGFWSVVDPQVAQSLPVTNPSVRPSPERDFPDAFLGDITMSGATGQSYEFTATVNAEPSEGSSSRVVIVTVEATPDGYLVSGLS